MLRKLIQGRTNLIGNRSDNLLVPFAKIFVQPILLRFPFGLQVDALLLLGLDRFLIGHRRFRQRLDFIGQRIETLLKIVNSSVRGLNSS